MGVKPIVLILADSVDVSLAVNNRLESLTVTDTASDEADTLTIELENADERLDAPAEGRLLEVSIGYDGIVTRMGMFVVDEVSASGPPSKVTVTARSAPFDASGKFGAMQTRKRRSFELTTIGELVATIAADAHLAPVVAAELAAIPLPHVDQSDESDIHLLQRIARDYGAFVKPTFGRLLFQRVSSGKTASGLVIPPIPITRSMVSGYTFNKCRREELACVVACYRDTSTGQDIDVQAGSGSPVERLRYPYPSETAALAAARGRLSEASRGAGTVSITVPGNPLLQGESVVLLTGFPLNIDGTWTVRRATHTVTPDSGYSTSLECEQPEASAASGTPVDANGGGSLDAGGLDPVAPLTPSVP